MTRLLLACLMLCLTNAAHAAVTFKVATVVPDGTLWMQEMRKGAEEIERRTEGRAKFRFFPGGVMGNDKSVLRKIRIGQLHGGAIVSGSLTEIFPDIALYNVPFTFHSFEEVDYVRQRMDETLIKGLESNGYVSFGISEGGFAYLMSKRRVDTIDDLKGQKAWVLEDDRISRMSFEAIGVSPIPLPLTDVLTGLQTGLIDTVANSPLGSIAMQWHTQVQYFVDLPLEYIYATLIINRKTFEKLTPQDQTTVRQIMGETFRELDQLNRADGDGARLALKKQGVQFIDAAPELRHQASAIRGDVVRTLTEQHILSQDLVSAMEQHLRELRHTNTAARP